MEKSLLIDTILIYHLRKESAKANSTESSPSRKESAKKTHQSLLHQGKRVLRKIHQNLLRQGKRVLRKTHQILLHHGKRVLKKIHQSILHQGKRVLRKIYQNLLLKKSCFVDETNRTSQANSDSYKTYFNAKKGACNEARSSEEEHFGMSDSMKKGDFEHSNEESNGKSSDEEENQLPMCGRKDDAKNLNER